MTTTSLEKLLAAAAATQGKTFVGADGRAYSYPAVRFDKNGNPLK
jgi:hypothetical protein